MVPTWTGRTGKPVRERSGNFEQTGKVREFYPKYWKMREVYPKYWKSEEILSSFYFSLTF